MDAGSDLSALIAGELWSLVGANSNPLAAGFVQEMVKTIRGLGGIAITSTQGMQDLFGLDGGKYGKGILDSSRIKLVMQMEEQEARLQKLANNAFCQTGTLAALADSGQPDPDKLQKTLEQTAAQFESATLEVRKLCERYSTGTGGYGSRPVLPPMEIAGSVEMLGYNWLHITLNTLLPHCRFQPPEWLSDTIRRLLDDYEAQGCKLPFFNRALLVIDEHTGSKGRHIFDQDNKGYKAVSNAIKGRLIPDDDQHTLGLARCPGGASWMCATSLCWTCPTRRTSLPSTPGTMR